VFDDMRNQRGHHHSDVNPIDEVQLDRTANQIEYRRSYKSLAQNLPSLVRNLTSRGKPSYIGNLRIEAAPLHTANLTAVKLQRPGRYQGASSFHKSLSNSRLPALSRFFS
jgi:hypothetical protein